MFRSLFVSTFFSVFFLNSSAQDAITLQEQGKDLDVLYRNEMTGGILAHSNGFGANFRRIRHMTGFKKRIWEFELVNMKHPKETKTTNPAFPNSKSFFYGKLNSVLVFRPGIGYQKIIYGKAERKSVQISYCCFLGASLAFAKPVYLEIVKRADLQGDFELSEEKYDPLRDSLSNIYGRAPYFRGFDEMKIYPGAYAKFGLNFDYADLKNDIKAIETGLTIDTYPTAVPIMGLVKNQQVYVCLYIHLLYGKKWF